MIFPSACVLLWSMPIMGIAFKRLRDINRLEPILKKGCFGKLWYNVCGDWMLYIVWILCIEI